MRFSQVKINEYFFDLNERLGLKVNEHGYTVRNTKSNEMTMLVHNPDKEIVIESFSDQTFLESLYHA